MIEFRCACGREFEHFCHPTAAREVTQNPCECGLMAARNREITHAPAVVWTGPLSQRYRNKDGQDYHAPDGQWAYTRRGPGGETIKPTAVRLETWQDVHEYAKHEGCYDPRDLPKNLEVSEDGKSSSSRGFRGQEV
jgi:hypothetical protein